MELIQELLGYGAMELTIDTGGLPIDHAQSETKEADLEQWRVILEL